MAKGDKKDKEPESPIAKVMRGLQKKFDPKQVKKDFTLYVSLGEADAEKYTIWVTAKKAEFKPGKHLEKADCVLKTDPELFEKIATTDYTPGMMEFMSGKIKTNDVELLKQFRAIFGVGGK